MGSSSDIQKWEIYIKHNLSKSLSKDDERFRLAVLELETPYIELGFDSLRQFLLQIPTIGNVLIEQENIIRSPKLQSVGSSPLMTIGDKVVWFHEEGTEIPGVIKWLGLVEDVLCARVVSENAMYTTYQMEQLKSPHAVLFDGRLGRGKILPVTCLVKHNGPVSKLKQPLPVQPNIPDEIPKPTKGVKTMDLASQSVTFKKELPDVVIRESDSRRVLHKLQNEKKEAALKVMDVVVWVTDRGIYDGIVMWMGQLTPNGQIFAGVDFQQNIGDTNGKYGKYKLFRCNPKQGKFIPIAYLIKYDDFYKAPSPPPQVEEFEIRDPKSEEDLSHNNTQDLLGIDFSNLKIEENNSSEDIGDLVGEIQNQTGFKIGDRVKYLRNPDVELMGTIKWLGKLGIQDLAGIEFEKEIGLSKEKEQVLPFEFKRGYGGLAPLSKLKHIDPLPEKLQDINYNTISRSPDEFYRPKNMDTDSPQFLNTFIEKCAGVENLGRSIGYHQGIQGANNSCYIDASLFLMLTYTDCFDNVLLQDDPCADDFVRYLTAILRIDIANQLRRNYFCSSKNVHILRNALSTLSKRIGNLQMADVEEFLYILLEHGLKLQRFIHYSSGISEFLHQILPNPKDLNPTTTTQKLLENSMFTQNNLKFLTPPTPGLFMVLPRSKNAVVQYRAVIPSLTIDITHLLNDSARPCTICNVGPAKFECLDCFDMIGNGGMSATSFCDTCFHTFHTAESRQGHKENARSIIHTQGKSSDPILLDLLGVICIKDSHYVSFAKCGSGTLAPWVVHNSMADEGIPEIKDVPGLGECLEALEKDPASLSKDWDQFIPEVKQILKDIYFCVYTLRKGKDD